MSQRKKPAKKRPLKSGSLSSVASATDPWDRKGVAINLSRARREALRAFAASDEGAASPAQALYALIDKLSAAAPRSAKIERPSTAASPNAEAPLAMPAGLEEKIAAVERLALDNAEALAQCADSLEQIAAAMEPMRELMSALMSQRRPSRAAALEPSEWIRRAVSALGCSPRSALVFRLALRERASDGAETLALTFEAAPVAVEKSAVKPPVPSLPLLRLTGVPAHGELGADSTDGRTGALFLSCLLADRGRWSAQIRRQAAGGSFSACLFSFSA